MPKPVPELAHSTGDSNPLCSITGEMVKRDNTKLKLTERHNNINKPRNTSTFKILTLNICGIRGKEIEHEKK
jgi:hypothetical protein